MNLEANFIKRLKFSKALRMAKRVPSIPTGCHFSLVPYFDNGDFVLCPMKSGREALIQIFRETPTDPGDQHFYTHKVIGYVKPMKKVLESGGGA
jgi:hypothetical protein